MVKIILLCLVMAASICGCGWNTVEYVDSQEGSDAQESEGISEPEQSNPTEETVAIYVYICGAVKTPGVYAMQGDDRICDLIQMAGGFTEEAASDYWNQARPLVDGEMIYVPTVEEAKERTDEERETAAAGPGQGEEPAKSDGKVNINTASKEELMTLPGIGESKALAILAYREKNGGFSSVEELKEVEGIKDGVFAKIVDFIIVN